jgi:hypothetical protein
VVEIVFTKLKNYKSQGSDQIPAELIQAGGEILWSGIHKLINFIRKNCLISGRSLLVYQFTGRVIKLTFVIIGGYHLQNFIQYSSLKFKSIYIYIYEVIGDHQCGVRSNRSTTDQIFCVRQTLKKNGNTMRQYISYS